MHDSGRLSLSIVRTESRPISNMQTQLVDIVEQASVWATYLTALQQESEKRLKILNGLLRKLLQGSKVKTVIYPLTSLLRSFMKSSMIST